MIYARVLDAFGDYEIEDPVLKVDGYLGLLFEGWFKPRGAATLIEGSVRLRGDRWWICSDDWAELSAMVDAIDEGELDVKIMAARRVGV